MDYAKEARRLLLNQCCNTCYWYNKEVLNDELDGLCSYHSYTDKESVYTKPDDYCEKYGTDNIQGGT
jgi:hypothetical protein